LRYILRYSGLSGPVKAGHFHGPAETCKNAGVALGINNAGDSPVQGSAVLTGDQAADLLAGKWYVNLHTAANPGGELRRQVAPEKRFHCFKVRAPGFASKILKTRVLWRAKGA